MTLTRPKEEMKYACHDFIKNSDKKNLKHTSVQPKLTKSAKWYRLAQFDEFWKLKK
jgi:hypothetical protein